MKHRIRTSRNNERGAVAVEFALVAPILISLIIAIVEFSNAYNIQVSVTQASREAARTMAITNDSGKATAAGKAGAPSLDTSKLSFSYSGACAAGSPPPTITVTTTYSGQSLTGFFGSSLTVTGKGAMQCNG
ncbi:TadE/TadG family type IV pilus assembly protein [Arthrobacter sp. 2RAF6]|uniref:TadE/TadG family type IV pilus assembly protein n=1 Tax=Arthrobacter sp. 2RAF6 TaxID=3233002 RepID=UPI003F91B3BE